MAAFSRRSYRNQTSPHRGHVQFVDHCFATRSMLSYLQKVVLCLLFVSSTVWWSWRPSRHSKFTSAATITEQWEDEYSKVGKVMHKYAQNTKFKALRGIMVVPGSREVVWLTERCNFASAGFDDCDFYLQNVQTLMSIEHNPICRRAGGLSFSLDPWDSSDIWGNLYRKVYYPAACASILRSSIAGATMFDADWDLKQLVNNTLGVGDEIDGYQSVDQLVDLSNYLHDESANQTAGSSATTALTMTRLWVAVTGIEEAVTPDHSVLYFGNVSIEVRAASVVKNVSTPSGFSDAKQPPPMAYRKFVEIINRNMHQVLLHLKSFRQLAQLAVAQEAVKFIAARQGVFPDGYLQSLDYPLDLPQQVPAVVSSIDKTTTFEIISQLIKQNASTTSSTGADDVEMDTLVAANVREKSQLDETSSFPIQELGDNSNYQYSCSVVNGSIALLQSLQQVLSAQRLALNCELIVEKGPDESQDQHFEASPQKEEPHGIFCEKAGFVDPCLPGAVAVWDVSAASYIMVPSAYLFIPGIPRMYNSTGDVVVVKWGCTWPEPEADTDNEAGEAGETGTGNTGGDGTTSARSARGSGDDVEEEWPQRSPYSAASFEQESDYFVHTHTHYGVIPPGTSRNARRLQMVYNTTLPGYVDRHSIDSTTVSLEGKVVVVVMPRSWETLPAACALPSLLRELQSDWVFGSDGLSDKDGHVDIDLDGDPEGATSTQMPHNSRFHSMSVGTVRDSGSIGSGVGAVAGVVLVNSVDFILPVVEIDSSYLGDVTLNAPVRVISHNYGVDLVEQIQSSSVPLSASLACGISRTADVKEEETDNTDEDTKAQVFSVEFGKSHYRTLDGVSINSAVIGCQAEYLQIPEGYELVPPLEDILTHVVAEHSWGTDKVILSDMNAYCTTLGLSHRPGKLIREIPIERDPQVSANGTQHKALGDREDVIAIRPSVCSSRILIRTKPIMVPYGGFFYHTLDLVAVEGDSGCQLAPLVLPEFCQVAPAISDVLNNIVAPHNWGTDALILQDRRAYFTSRAGPALAGKVCCDRDELLYVVDQPKNATDSVGDSDADNGGASSGPSGTKSNFARGNASAPHWTDTVQVLSVLRCNTRILVRQPIVTIVPDDTVAPSALNFQDLKKVTQAVTLNITRISYGDTTESSGKSRYSGTEFRGKLLPGTVRSHIYSLSVHLKYTQFTHGGVDLMNIKVTRMSEVPADVLMQLRERSGGSSSAGSSSSATTDEGGDGYLGNQAGRIVPETQRFPPDTPARPQPMPQNATSTKSDPIHSSTMGNLPKKNVADNIETCAQIESDEDRVLATGSGGLGGRFAVDFQERRNAWGKRLGAAMDHLDNHILGNADADAGSAVDFIYRPSSFGALKEATVLAPSALVSEPIGCTGDMSHETRQEMVQSSIQEVVLKVKLARRRYFADSSTEDTASASDAEIAPGSAARAITALLVETAFSHTQFLVEYQKDGLVYAHLVGDVRPVGVAGMVSIFTSTSICASKSVTAVTPDIKHDWKLQQRWSEIAPRAGQTQVTVAALMQHMQQLADQRGPYSAQENNCHLAQEDGRRLLGLSVDLAQSLLL